MSLLERSYLAAWVRLTGRALTANEVEVGYHWAQAQIDTQYLAYVCRELSTEEVETMLERRARALDALGEALQA